MGSYEIIIPLKFSDSQSLRLSLPYIIKNIDPSRVIVITNGAIEFTCTDVIRSINEDHLLDGLYSGGLSLSRIKALIRNRIGNDNRAGWYFQQFLKMGFALRQDCPPQYLVWDADTIPLRPIQFERGGKSIFYQTYECNTGYFHTLRRLFYANLPFVWPMEVKRSPYSFISESMLIQRDVMRDLIKKIEDSSPGKPFFEIVLSAVESSNLPFSGFSEFETYGTFYLSRFERKDIVLDRTLRRFRYGRLLVGEHPTPDQLDSLSGLLDVVSFEIGHPFGSFFPSRIYSQGLQRLFLFGYWTLRRTIWMRNLIWLWCLFCFPQKQSPGQG